MSEPSPSAAEPTAVANDRALTAAKQPRCGRAVDNNYKSALLFVWVTSIRFRAQGLSEKVDWCYA
jgi:hypothetical protein